MVLVHGVHTAWLMHLVLCIEINHEIGLEKKGYVKFYLI